MPHLLSRDEFKAAVFGRDKHKCVFCSEPAVDAHHIMDRKLFPDGGYYLNNGASVCEPCHMMCENNTYTVDEVRSRCGITEVILPVDFEPNYCYDKWANIFLNNGTRIAGPLFNDTSVQTLFRKELHMYEHLVKYGHTPHMPQSRSRTDDDRVLTTMDHFIGEEVVFHEKMDGENASLYNHHYHARSLDSRHHVSRDWIKSFWATKKNEIPIGWRVCGENMFAEHSIRYDNLPSYFLGFSVWNNENVCLSYDDTLEWFDLLGITPVREVWRGIYVDGIVESLVKDIDTTKQEGLVMRKTRAYHYDDFGMNIAKYVRPKHVNTDTHWMSKEVIPNGLAK